MLNIGHELRKVMEKVMESQGILKAQKSTNLVNTKHCFCKEYITNVFIIETAKRRKWKA